MKILLASHLAKPEYLIFRRDGRWGEMLLDVLEKALQHRLFEQCVGQAFYSGC